MARHNVFHPSYKNRTVTINTADADGVKTSAATPVAATEYETTDLDGANMSSTLDGYFDGKPYAVSVTTGASVGTYNTTDPIIVEGFSYLARKTVHVSLQLTAANGGETISSNVMLDHNRPIKIYVPAQNDANGTFEFGTTVATAIVPVCHSIAVNDVSGGNVINYREGGDDYNSTPTAGGIASNYEERPWQVAEIHSGTTVASIVAKYGGAV